MELEDALDSETNLQAGAPAWPTPSWPGQQPAWPNQPYQPWSGPPTGPGWPGPAPPTAPQNVQLTVPFEMPLPLGVYDKLLITIIGETLPQSKRFSVNLLKNNDIAFHFNPRFDDYGKNLLVRNTKINNVWGSEEREAPSFPFVKGMPFELKILCTASEYKVAVDKVHLLEYKHRLHELNQINRLTIVDDVKLTSVNLENLP